MMHVLSAALLYVCVTDERTDLKKSLVYFLCGLSVPILIGWEQVLSGSSPDSSVLGMAAKDAGTAGVAVVETVSGRLMRAYGTFPHPNIFGGYVAFGFIGLAWLARFVRTRVQLAGALLGSVLLAGTLLVTFSRSAWLGLLIAFLLLVGVMYLQKKTPSRKGFSIILLGGLTFLSTLLLFHTQVFSRFNPSERLEIISIQERASQYQTFGQVFEASPLLGVGPGAYTFMLEHLNPDQPVWFYQPIHNTFLLILGELGVVGFIFLFYLIFSLNPIANADVKSAGGVFAMMGGILFFEIALFDHYLWSLWPGLALIALGSGCIAHWMFTKDIA